MYKLYVCKIKKKCFVKLYNIENRKTRAQIHSADPDVAVHFELPHLDLHYLQVKPFSFGSIILMHSERPKLYTILVFLSAIGLNNNYNFYCIFLFF